MQNNEPNHAQSVFLNPASFAGMVILVALVLLLPIGSRGVSADVGEIWRMQVGDAPANALPRFDDSNWSVVSLPATWDELDLQGVDGSLWFRTELLLTKRHIELAEGGDLGLAVGGTMFGDLEVFADGESVGRSQGWSLPLAEPFPAVFNIPATAVVDSGRLVLALRVRRTGWASDRVAGGPVGDRLDLGSFGALASGMEVARLQSLINDSLYLVLASLFLVVALYHFQLFRRRREQPECLWFGLTSLFFAGNTFLLSSWAEVVTLRADFILRMGSACGHLAAAAAIQFLWPFLLKSISRPLRLYQMSHVVIALWVATWPVTSLVVDTAGYRFLWLVPLILMVTWLIIRESWRGTADARTIAWGCLAVVVAELLEVAVSVFGVPLNLPFSAPALAFGIVVGAMAVSISNRFQRVHNQVDALRLHLEDEVRGRTAALEIALSEAEVAGEAKNEFLSTVSHELRTPLNAIIGLAELLGDSDLDVEDREFVEAIRTSGDELFSLITEVLDFSRIESGQVGVESIAFNPLRVLNESLEMNDGAAAAKGLVLRSEIEGSIPSAIVGDPVRVRRIVVQLLSNAIKFTSEGEIVATVSARNEGRGTWELCFAVADTGIGIDQETAAKVFDYFRQGDGSMTRRYGGIGIGLATCRRLADLMGGDLWFDSRIGEGSTFYFKVSGSEPPEPVRRSMAS